MANRKSEAEFVNDGFSAEEIATLEGAGNGAGQVIEEGGAPEGGQPQQEQQVQTGQGSGQPEGEQEPRMVDIRALQESRASERALKEELARTRSEQIRLDERLKMLNEVLTKQGQPQEPKPPTEEEDPWAYMQHKLSSTEKRLAELQNAQQAVNTHQQQLQQRQTVVNQADRVFAMAAQTNPDIHDALAFASASVQNEIARRIDAAGLTGLQAQAEFERLYTNTIYGYAAECPTDPNEAAEHIRRHARYWGWTGMPQPQDQQNQQGQQPQQEQQVRQQPTVQQRAEQQERHMSLSSVQGGSSPVSLDAKSLAAMSDEQFKELMKTASGRKQIEQVMGGV